MRIARTGLAALATATALAACGGSSPATHLTAAQQAGARQLTAAESALTHVKSLRVTTVLHTAAGQSSRSVADIVPGNRMRVRLYLGDQRSELRLTGGYAYLHANAAYWQASGTSAGAASLLTPHWFKLPVDTLSGAGSLLALLHSSTLGECTIGLPESTTTVSSRAGGTTVLTQRGDGTVDRITLRSDSSLPISEQRTGPGVTSVACGTTSSTQRVSTGTTTFGRYGVPVSVSVPARALNNDQLTRLQSAITKRP